MSGMKNLANALQNDPSFKTDGKMTKSEAAKYVPDISKGPKPPKFQQSN